MSVRRPTNTSGLTSATAILIHRKEVPQINPRPHKTIQSLVFIYFLFSLEVTFLSLSGSG